MIVVELDGTVRNYTPEVPRIFIMKKDAEIAAMLTRII